MNFNLECTSSVFTDHEGFRLHQIGSGKDTFFTNAFVVETVRKLVIVDSMMTVSQAQFLRDYAKNLDKPMAAILITHPHPDHYNGVAELQDAGHEISVITTQSVDAAIRAGIDSKEQKWRPVFGSEWPNRPFEVNRFMADGEVLEVDGVPFKLLELGMGESSADTLWLVGKPTSRALFVGDLVFNDMHSFISDGHTGQWLEVLSRVETIITATDRIYTGHGQPGAALELIADQRAYLRYLRYQVATLARGKSSLDLRTKEKLMIEMNTYLNTSRLADFVMVGADAVASEMAASPTATNELLEGLVGQEARRPTAEFHLAQMSISKAKAPLEHPMMAEFVAQLPIVNAVADQSPGFVWRHQTKEGDSTNVRAFEDPSILMNMSLWKSLKDLKAFVFKGAHATPYKNGAQWFDRMEGHVTVLWWVPSGYFPTPEEGVERLARLNAEGESAEAFSFRKPFPAPEQ
ncbi:DUF3291 domain-containing protein [Pseudomonas sp. MWU12-2534b]|nr:DUF3291 domain-containing protein [Pseudomonas sp. MWU12-2534b]